MILKQFRQYTINGVNYTSHADIQKSLNLTREQVRYRRIKDPDWLIVVKGPSGVKAPKKEYYICDGIKYLTLTQAALAHGITKEAVRQRVKKSKWNWFKVVDGVPQPKLIKPKRILDKDGYYYKKKMGIPTPRPKKYKKNRVRKTSMPRNLSEYLDAMFAKKEAKKSKKTLDILTE